MSDILETLVRDAFSTIQEGYYEDIGTALPRERKITQAISSSQGNAIIAEVKFSSPSLGVISKSPDHLGIAESMVKGGAIALSVLTEPKHFAGSLKYLEEISLKTKVPILMKDIFLASEQIRAASQAGADAVILISSIFRRGLVKVSKEKLIEEAHELGLEVILECHDLDEFSDGLKSKADIIGINNRNLGTMEVSLDVSRGILSSLDLDSLDKIVIVESGIKTPADIKILQKLGAKAFLVGSSIMASENIEEKVALLVNGR
ncbi:MAG: indole-3-glycerol-phosphate synthase [Nitrososphaerales archaeon]